MKWKLPEWLLALIAGLSAFATYSCMYAFRKPFTAAGFEGMIYLGVSYKVWLVVAQVFGYMFSKFYGIRFIAENQRQQRSRNIITLIVVAWLALLGFALTPAPWNIPFLFVNGFPLGMIWGLVFSYLEGRRTTEWMGLLLACSFIFASGLVKSVGKWILLYTPVNAFWMPFVTGMLFILPLLLFVNILDRLPAPSEKDIEARSRRLPMNHLQRQAFIRQFFPGLLIIITTYILLTIVRDIRDNFANEILLEAGLLNSASIFASTEIPVTIGVVCILGLLAFVRSNRQALLLNHMVIIAGFLVTLSATWLFQQQYINAYIWFLLTGTGLYTCYIPFNCLFFERLIATFRIAGNVGFVMYLADSFGYLGSAGVLIIKEFTVFRLSWLDFFIRCIYFSSITGVLLTALAAWYFHHTYLQQQKQQLSYE